MKLFSNEVVFRGHPDKVCDQIASAILDECLKQDEGSRCGIEVVGGKGTIFITGEITSEADYDVAKIAKRVLRDIGYHDDYEIIDNIGKQSPDIAMGTNDEVQGAGDQGMMFGYACNETKELLPIAMMSWSTAMRISILMARRRSRLTTMMNSGSEVSRTLRSPTTIPKRIGKGPIRS